MDAFDEDEYEWQPPSEAEMKIIQARRERSNKISKLMGDYLLKGYKMLGAECKVCGTILLRDKQDRDYCVSCNELDSDTDKDDPVVNQAAARSQVREYQRSNMNEPSREIPRPDSPSCLPHSSSRLEGEVCADEASYQPARDLAFSPKPPLDVSSGATSTSKDVDVKTEQLPVFTGEICTKNLTSACEALQNKIRWASDELSKTSSIEASIQLCQLMKSAAEALKEVASLKTQTK